ncbi:MAG: uracil-DNA glycosylase [Gammaproteobacteria bacterium]|nr:uracil-DNA glycosylase [Gammaproteobacteria bacterium]
MTQRALEAHRQALMACTACPNMIGPVVSGEPVMSPILMVGQAPGDKEGQLGRPFAWTAGKTLFKWYASIGFQEEAFRHHVYMAAVCRCFPGKNPKGGDRVPHALEIATCGHWLDKEIALLKPKLLIPVGKLAIAQFMRVDKLKHIIGSVQRVTRAGHTMDTIALPHPSGASTWHRKEPGKALLAAALEHIARHPAWQETLKTATLVRVRGG